MNRYRFFGLLGFLLMLPQVGSADTVGGEEAAFLVNTRPLTLQGRRAGEGYFSPDGNHLIFQSEREEGNPFFQIYIMNLLTGDTHRVSPGYGKTTCAYFRPGSNEVVFASTHLDPRAKEKQREEIEFRASGHERRYSWDYDEWFDIFSCLRDGSEPKQLTDSPGYDAEASYSPDGSRIVFCSIRDAHPLEDLSEEDRRRYELDPAYFGEIYIMNADGSGQTRLTEWPGYDGGPFFSPDGQRILWRHFGEDGMNADVYTMSTDGSDRQQLTDFASMSWAPYFHPSGAYVIFTSNKLGFTNFELYIVDAAGLREPVRVTFTDKFDGLPTFSPDGARLAWTSGRTASGESQLFVADWNHAAALAALQNAPLRGGAAADKGERTSADELRAHVEYLASDELEGRMTGTHGARLAAKYIGRHFERLGLEPAGDNGSYLQEFPFTSGIRVVEEKNHLEVVNDSTGRETVTFELDEDFRPLAVTSNDEVSGPVVFAGYGLVVPGDLETGYDSYAGLDVEGKIVLALRYVPEDVDMERRMELNQYHEIRYKAMHARNRGAKALLIVTGPNSPAAGELVPLKFDQSTASSEIVAVSVSRRVADAILAGSGTTLDEVQSELDTENPHYEGSFELPGVTVTVSTGVEHEKEPGHNVIALLPPATIDGSEEYVVLGAHYDHIGYGEIGSMAKKGEEGLIHNGADDNASGTATVLELASAMAVGGTGPQRGVLFCLWSGEELGTVGSSYFVDHPVVDLERIVAYVNFDMVGRLRDNVLKVQGTGSSDAWTGMIERRNVAAGFDLKLQADPYLPTDVTPFYQKKVPVLSFFTGSHEDYNRPTDDPETLNYLGMARIASFALALSTDLVEAADRPEYAKVVMSKSRSAGRGGLRAYLGTIPDYTSDDVEGVALSGVRAGSPADKAGLQEGDIIVEFAGQKITNIYDYTYALGAVKIGEPVAIVVLRDDERVKLTVVPEVRK